MGSHHTGLNGHTELAILNQDRAVLPGPDLLHQLISTAASDKIAIDFLNRDQTTEQISYTQLRSYATNLGRALLVRSYGTLGSQKIIPVIMPQCPELYVSYLAILEVGAAFCPISPDVPLERLKFIIADIDASVVLTMHDQCDRVKAAFPDLRCIPVSLEAQSDIKKVSTDGQCSFRSPRPKPNDTAYVMYTSGSTGLPKGVKISHQSVTQSLMAHDEHIPKFQRFLQFASPTFDVSVFEIFFPLFRGATLVCCEREMMLADLPDTIRTLNIDAAELTPTVASTLLRSRKVVPDLKVLLTIGEMLNRHVVSEFGGSDTQDSILYAMYGPTEASIHCTIAPQLAAQSSVKNIGLPLRTVTAFILAESQDAETPQILLFGQTGELAIAGQLANEYLKRPEQTAAAFIDLPGYGQVYRTGDRALIPNDGEIHILGRISTGQVKLRGQRVELGEIEEVACKTPGVEIAVAAIVNEALVLFCSGSDKLSIQDVRSTCRSWLPSFMRPTDIKLLPQVPRLPSGKIDRNSLNDLYQHNCQQNHFSDNTFINSVERNIAECLQHELNTKIGPGSVLRSLGLDSLRAIKIAAALRPSFPSISALMLLEADTVHDLAERLGDQAETHMDGGHTESYEDSEEWQKLRSEVKAKLTAEGLESLVEDVTPCTSLQVAMLGETTLSETMNFNTIELELCDRVRIDDLKQALVQLAASNEILRSGFINTAAHQMPFAQVIWSELTLDQDLDISHPFQLTVGHDESHVLVSIHHALYDGWSWGLLMSDLDVLLNHEFVVSRPSFGSYRRWTEACQDAHSRADRDYWQENMHEARPLSLPDMRGTRGQTIGRQSCVRSMSTDLQTVDEAVVNHRISRQTIIQTAMTLLLSTYCDTSDVLCGIVVSGRERPFPNIEQLIGPCLSTYPLRIDLSSVDTVRDLLLYVHRQSSACLKYGSITLSQIQQIADIEPTERVFDALCVWQDDLQISPDSNLVRTISTTDALKYGIVLEAEPQAGRVLTKLTFDTSKIPHGQAELMLKQIDSLLAFLTTKEEKHLTQSWRFMRPECLSVVESTSKTLDWTTDLTTTIARLADEDPDRVAIEMVHDFDPNTGQKSIECLTYRLMYEQATNIANNLIRKYRIQTDDIVCIVLDKSLNLYTSILAVLLAGGAYLCLDPRSPDDRIKRTLEKAKCKAIITDFFDRIRSCVPSSKNYTDSPQSLGNVADNSVRLPVRVNRDALAYAVFTSGSTGTPKGVLLTRKNLLSHIKQVSTLYPHHSRGARLLQACSQAFDVSVFEIFWTWHAGMTLCSASNDVLFRDLEKFINATAVTHLSMTPSVAALLDPVNVPAVKFLVTAGEPMNSKVFHSWSDRCLFQGYGPSETTNICNVRPWVSSNDQINNTGPAFANTSLFVCRRQMTKQKSIDSTSLQLTDFVPLPRGAVGEIWIGGDQVGRGYIDPDLTSRSFFDHPDYGRLYRSGDIGRLLADDNLLVLGREDGQVKLRGQRVELGEINSTLVENEHIKDAVTVIVDKLTNARLVTFYVLQHNCKESPDSQNTALYEWLQNRLPSYMIPDTLFPIDAIPLTRQGKVDHRAVTNVCHEMTVEEKRRFSRHTEDEESESEPCTETEVQVARALSDVTNTPLGDISRTSSFFGLGLDSISSIRLAQRLRRDGFGTVDVSTILKNPSIVRLVDHLTDKRNMADTTVVQDLDNLYNESWQNLIRSDYDRHGYQIDKILPCTPLQEAMLSSGVGGHHAYHNSLAFRIHVSLEAMHQSWNAMVERHDLLRTVFVETQDIARPFAQVVLKSCQLQWAESGQHVNGHDRVRDISLPAYRFTVTSRTKKDGTLVKLEIHHALYDAEAMSLLLRDIEYTIRGEAIPTPIPFQRYIEYMANLNADKTDAFWSTLLNTTRPSRLEVMMSDVASRAGRPNTASVSARLSLSVLESHVRSNKITLASLFQTCLARLLSCYIHVDDVCFGNVFSGRNIAVSEVQNIIGPCFNTLPLRAKIKKNTSIKALSRQLYQDNLEIIPYQTSSLRRIQKQHSKDGKALFDVMLLMQQQQPKLDSKIWDLVEETGDMLFPYIFEITPNGASNTVELALHCQHYDRASTEKLLEHFEILLEHTVRFPQALASDFSSIKSSLPDLKSISRFTNDNGVSKGTRSSENERLWSPTEVKVRNILHDLTTIEQDKMSLSTTIFKLGLDSINAVLIASKLRSIGFAVSSADILEKPSIEEIAMTCDDKQNSGIPPEATYDVDTFHNDNHEFVMTQLSNGDKRMEAILPCTATQSGILTQFIKSRGKFYFNRTTVSFQKSINVPRLQSSLEILVRRHEILRTGFVQLDNAKYPFAMVVYAPETHPLPLRFASATGNDLVVHSQQAADNLQSPSWEIVLSDSSEVSTMDVWMLHALYDATSMRIMLDDLEAIYEDHVLTSISSWKSVLSQFVHRAQDSADAKQFWLDAGSCMEVTRFPDMNIYYNREQQLSTTMILSSISQYAVEERCAELNVGLQSICQIAWARLLAAYTGQSSVTFGVILSGRTSNDDWENRISFPCINTVPFAVELEPRSPSFLRKVSRQNAGYVKHQFIPLNTIKRWNSISEDLFDTVLVLQKLENTKNETSWTVSGDEASVEYAVSIEIVPNKEGHLELQLTYRPNVVPQAQAQIILEEYQQLLVAELDLIDNMKNSHHDIEKSLFSILPPHDGLISTTTSFLHRFVTDASAIHPNRVALEFVTDITGDNIQKQTWTYADLDTRGNQYANLLLSHDVKVGDLIAVCFDKCPEASFAILGVLKAGCAYVAVDPGAPIARKSFILEDAGCKIVLTTPDKVSEFDGESILVIDACKEDIFKGIHNKAPMLNGELTSDDTCYCLYTSGTTGTPKGCLISHRSAVQAMMSFQRIFHSRWTTESRWLQFASFHFDVSVLEQYWSWSVGICVTSAPRDLLFEDLPGTISKLGITHLDLTPSLARLLTPSEVPQLCNGVFIVGGEQVRQDVLDTWAGTGCLYNFYGPSEVTIGCTVHPQVKKNARPTNIGQQWDNVGTLVLEPLTTKPVIQGAIGELCLSGSLVGKGYLNRPELTAEKFVTIEGHETKIYRTGDLVRLLHDNSFDFLGRIDDQIKLRGQRLEIGEINHVLISADTSVKDVSTLVLNHPQQEKEQLIAFFTTSSKNEQKYAKASLTSTKNSAAIIDQLKLKCAKNLPQYMLPTYFLEVNFMPLNINNKTDNKALKALYCETPVIKLQGGDETKEVSSEETPSNYDTIILTLARFFDIEESSIKPTSRLFEIGLDSISVIALSRILKRKGFAGAEVSTVMASSIVINLAQKLSNLSDSGSSIAGIAEAKDQIKRFTLKHSATISSALNVANNVIEHIASCTPLQEGMISKAAGSDSRDVPYFAIFTYRLNADVDIIRLQAAWKRVSEHVDILRTYFVSTEDGYAQAVLKKSKMNSLHLLGTSVLADTEDAFRNWILGAKNFGKVLPWQICFTQGEDEAQHMSLLIFHGLYDGSSLRLLLDMVINEYHGDNDTMRKVPEFYKVLPYGLLRSQPGAKEFWQQQITNIELLHIRPCEHTSLISPTYITLDLCLSSLKKLCAQLNVTLSAVFHAAWLHTLQSHYVVNPTIGLVLSGRALEIDDADRVIGPLFNTVPCSIPKLKTGSTLSNLIKACHDFNIKIIPHQHTSVRNINKWLKTDTKDGLFDSLFVFMNDTSTATNNAPRLWSEIGSKSSPDYPLNLEVRQTDETQFAVTFVAVENENLTRTDIDALLSIFTTTLEIFDKGNELELRDKISSGSSVKPDRIQHRTSRLTSDEVERKSEWNDAASRIRLEIAQLAGLETGDISLRSPTIFELGLDSIDALKLTARLKQAGLVVPVSKIMQSPTVAGISAYVESSASLQDLKQESVKNPSTKEDQNTKALLEQGSHIDNLEAILNVTPMQEGLLLDYKRYHHILVYQIHAEVDIGRLTSAIQKAVYQLPVLRSTFVTVDDVRNDANLLQLVKDAKSSQFSVAQCSERCDVINLVEQLREEANEAGLSGQKFTATIAKDSNGSQVLFLGMPHALYDGWSVQLLHNRIRDAYLNRDQSVQPSSCISAHVDAALRSASSRANRNFWVEKLQSACATSIRGSLKPDNPSPSMLIQQASEIPLNHASKLCRDAGVTLQSLGLLCWTSVLACLMRSPDVIHGIVLSGRTTEGSDELVFPTFNTACFRNKFEPTKSRIETLKETHRRILQTMEYQHFPLKDALKLSGHPRRQLFDTLFTFQKLPTTNNKDEVLYEEYEIDEAPSDPPYAINIEMTEKEGQIWWTIAVQQNVASIHQVQRILQQLDQVLKALCNAPLEPFLEQSASDTSICGLDPVELQFEKPELEPRQARTLHPSGGAETEFSELELAIRGVLAQVSKTDSSAITKDSSLFHLGLDSISAIKVSSLLKRNGIRLPVSDLVSAQNIKRMAELATRQDTVQIVVEKSDSMQSDENYELLLPKIGLAKNHIEKILPASAGQIYMLGTWEASKGRLFYATFWFEVHNAPLERLSTAFVTLKKLAPVLRTKFVKHNGQVYAVTIRSTSKDLEIALPWSYDAVEDQGRLLVSLKIHHALYDAVSLHIIVSTLQELCRNSQVIPHLETDSRPFLRLVQDMEKKAVARRRQFWIKYLSESTSEDSKGCELVGDFHCDRVEKFVPNVMSIKDLTSIIKRQGVGMQALFFAAYARVHARLLLQQHSGDLATKGKLDHVKLGIYLANRSLDLENLPTLAAPTFNILPLKVSVNEASSLVEVARQIQADLQEITKPEHCGASLRDIYEWTGVRLDLFVNFLKMPDEANEQAVFEDHAINFKHAEGETIERAQVALQRIKSKTHPSPFSIDNQSVIPKHEESDVSADNQWCLPAIDIEARITKEDDLAMGIFAPNDMLGQHDLDMMISEVKDLLLSVRD